MICPQCHENPAQYHPTWGILPCSRCQEGNRTIQKPRRIVEFTTDSIKENRKEYAKDILQPFRGGVVSKEYIEEYGSKTLGVSKKDIKKAKYVWQDLPNAHNRDLSKGGKQ